MDQKITTEVYNKAVEAPQKPQYRIRGTKKYWNYSNQPHTLEIPQYDHGEG